MCYICGKSSNKIAHTEDCRYVKLIPGKNKRVFRNIQHAYASGYKYCKYCSRLGRMLKSEEKVLSRICMINGIRYSFNPTDGSIDILSFSGSWKIVENLKSHCIMLFHKNTSSTDEPSMIKGYHFQHKCFESIEEHVEYIISHDEFREENPVYRPVNMVGLSKKAKKRAKKKERKARKTQGMRYVMAIFDKWEKLAAMG